ncbi:DUF2283 domain-containing protein [Actinospica sp. MGRD01-02]|uniref:DUF2283 domain-containing protein n=1 Tax=Actinospica acidithermotolerans TaxID=2828514 RepID=A0A941EHT8_9ACTN|nr:DUF2283 domain-containing protein [Actinospica acidithermotolerans]MBR7830950.1 DUF2283 domain-containing protein [Actinospica acidithermotolerans]
MRVTFDAEDNVGYIHFVEEPMPDRSARRIVAEDERGSAVVLDFDGEGRLIGVELLSARRQLHPDLLGTADRVG